MANELPALPFFTSDFLIAVSTWPTERVGAYALALFHQWEHEYVPANDPAQLALIFHTTSTARAKALWKEIAGKFDVDRQGRAQNMRLEEHRKDVQEKVAKGGDRGRKGARARWQKERLRRAEAAAQAPAQADAQASTGHSLGNANQNQSHLTPPVPPAARGAVTVHAGRITRDERKDAERALHAWEVNRDQWQKPGLDWADDSTWPTCPHDDAGAPACDSRETCIGALVQGARLRLASGQQRVLEAVS